MLKKFLLFAVVLIIITFLCGTRQVFSCGPFFDSPVFTYNLNPDIPLNGFTQGKLGVILPTFARSYLYAAYKQLSGKGFDEDEQNALLNLWNDRLKLEWRENISNLPEVWLKARNKVTQAGSSPDIKLYSDDSYNAYLRYLEDAFRNAAITLEERLSKFGPDSPEILEWVKAQDMVFSGSIPEPLDTDIDPLLQADRTYQIAAANFYAGNFDLAIEMFKGIASDSQSPWRVIAPYLVARSLIRKATLSSESSPDKEILDQAAEKLKTILNDKNLKDIHPPTRRLLGFVNYRLDPDKTLHELAKTLLNDKLGEDLKLYVDDYTRLLDYFMGEQDEMALWWKPEEREESRSNALKKLDESSVSDDLTEWIITFQTNGEIALNRSLEKWRKTSSLPWLLASLAKVNAGQPDVPKLLTEVEKVKINSPAYATVAFHSIRLMIESGKNSDAIKKLDFILSQDTSLIPVSSRNLFLAERMKIARNLDEFLKYTLRNAVGVTYDVVPVQFGYEEAIKQYKGLVTFDLDSIRIMDGTMPLGLLKEIATSETLPDDLRRRIAIVAWTRAALLEDYRACSEVTPILKSLIPELKEYLDAYVSAKDDESRQFAAIFLMLKFPGMQPDVVSAVGRDTPLDTIDSYRNNWWCSYAQNSDVYKKIPADSHLSALYPSGSVEELDFVNEAQKIAVKEEWAKLKALATGPNHLCTIVINWSKKNLEDPRVPEALHLAVRSTRYGCTDDDTTKFSKQAFQLLHKNYPKSEWATKTKYWF